VPKKKLLGIIINNPRNVAFRDFVALIEAFGFVHHRTNGSHRIYKHPKVAENLNIQPRKDGTAKKYQIDQFLEYIETYSLQTEG